MRCIRFLTSLHRRLARSDERGMTTAELLGNAALGIAALVAIWAVLQTLGLDVVEWIRGQLMS
jgi:hypothetical protein